MSQNQQTVSGNNQMLWSSQIGRKTLNFWVINLTKRSFWGSSLRSWDIQYWISIWFEISRLIRANNVPDWCSAKRAVTTSFSFPLLKSALVAHTHMSTHIQNSVYSVFIANCAFGASTMSCSILFQPTKGRVFACLWGNWLKRKQKSGQCSYYRN